MILVGQVRIKVEGEADLEALREYLSQACSVELNTEEHGAGPDDDCSVVGIEVDWATLQPQS